MKKLRTLRIERGWTQTELAKKAGVARPAISSLERCKFDYGFGAKTLKAVADALETPMLEIEEIARLLGEYVDIGKAVNSDGGSKIE